MFYCILGSLRIVVNRDGGCHCRIFRYLLLLFLQFGSFNLLSKLIEMQRINADQSTHGAYFASKPSFPRCNHFTQTNYKYQTKANTAVTQTISSDSRVRFTARFVTYHREPPFKSVILRRVCQCRFYEADDVVVVAVVEAWRLELARRSL